MHQELLKTFYQKISFLYQASLDHFIAPPFCAYCKQFLSKRMIFCIDCDDMIQPVVSVQTQITKTQSMMVMAVSDYQEPLKTLILSKSWSDIVACDQLGSLILEKQILNFFPAIIWFLFLCIGCVMQNEDIIKLKRLQKY